MPENCEKECATCIHRIFDDEYYSEYDDDWYVTYFCECGNPKFYEMGDNCPEFEEDKY